MTAAVVDRAFPWFGRRRDGLHWLVSALDVPCTHCGDDTCSSRARAWRCYRVDAASVFLEEDEAKVKRVAPAR
jgi:hypothetical protein